MKVVSVGMSAALVMAACAPGGGESADIAQGVEASNAEAAGEIEQSAGSDGGAADDAGSPDAAVAGSPVDLPRWHAYLVGRDATAFPFVAQPGALDFAGHVVAVRAGEEDKPERWLTLNLAEHWRKGDRYFDDMIEAGTVTAADLLVITADLLQNGERLLPAPRKGRSLEDRGGDWSPFPGFPGSPGSGGADHTGGPSGGPHRNPGPPPRGGHAGPPPLPHGNLPPPKPWKPDWRANGVEPGDPTPTPSPHDAG